MKRYGYDKLIPMLVTRVSSSEQNDRRYVWRNEETVYYNIERVLESCYRRFENIGISREAAREILKNPKATILDYLNASKYSYSELRDKYVSVMLGNY